MQTPGKYDITLYQGASFERIFAWKIDDIPVNLNGYTARMQVRRDHPAPVAVITLTTENDGIVLGGSAGTITLQMSPEQTEALDAAQHVYDIELVSPADDVYRILEGRFTISPEVTRG